MTTEHRMPLDFRDQAKASLALWSKNLIAGLADHPSFFLRALPEPTPEERAQREAEQVAWQAQYDADEARIPAFLADLADLCKHHGVTFKASTGTDGMYDPDSFAMTLGEASIDEVNIP